MIGKLKKSQPAPFRAPGLGDVDETYRAIENRLGDLHRDLAATRRERVAIDGDIHRNPPQRGMRSSVAELLGDAVKQDERPAKLSALRVRERDLEDAVEVLRRRLTDRRGPASVAAREAVRPEYGRRVAALIEALQATAEARENYENLCDEMEMNDIQWTGLGVFRPVFLGSRRDGHVQRLAREAKEAGYV